LTRSLCLITLMEHYLCPILQKEAPENVIKDLILSTWESDSKLSIFTTEIPYFFKNKWMNEFWKVNNYWALSWKPEKVVW
jgi:hypothetical protein